MYSHFVARIPKRLNPTVASSEAKVLTLGETIVASLLENQYLSVNRFSIPSLLLGNTAIAAAFVDAKEAGFRRDMYVTIHDSNETCYDFSPARGVFGNSLSGSEDGEVFQVVDAASFTKMLFALAHGLRQEVEDSRPSQRRTYVEMALLSLIY